MFESITHEIILLANNHQVITALWVSINLIATVMAICGVFEITSYNLSPKDIYDNSKLNIFGTIVVFLILVCIIPVYYLIMLIYLITHMGRM